MSRKTKAGLRPEPGPENSFQVFQAGAEEKFFELLPKTCHGRSLAAKPECTNVGYGYLNSRLNAHFHSFICQLANENYMYQVKHDVCFGMAMPNQFTDTVLTVLWLENSPALLVKLPAPGWLLLVLLLLFPAVLCCHVLLKLSKVAVVFFYRHSRR